MLLCTAACPGGDHYTDFDARPDDGPRPDGPDDIDAGIDAEVPDAGPTSYVTTYGSAGTNAEVVANLHAVSDGVIFTGGLGGDTMLGTHALDYVGGSEWVVGKLDTSGAPVWAAAHGNVNNDGLGGSAVDAAGDVIVAGRFGGTLNLGGSNLVSSSGSYDVFIAKYDGADGGHVWSVKYGGTMEDSVADVVVDAAGDVYVVGAPW